MTELFHLKDTREPWNGAEGGRKINGHRTNLTNASKDLVVKWIRESTASKMGLFGLQTNRQGRPVH